MSAKPTVSFLDLLKLSLRIFKTKPMRTFLTIVGMSVGIGAVVFLVSLGYGLQYILIGKLVTTEDSLITLTVSYPQESGLGIDAGRVALIGNDVDVAETSAVAEYPGELTSNDTSGLIPFVRLVDPNMFRLAGISPELGRPLGNDPNEIILSSQALLLSGLAVDSTTLGKTITLKLYYPNDDGTVREAALEKPLTIVGIFTDEDQPPSGYVSSAAAPFTITSFKEVLVKAKDIDTVEPLREKLSEQGFLISARIDLVTQARKITNILTTTLAVFGITALVVSAIGMFNTMLIGFIERTYEVGVMKAIGASDSTVRNLFLMESAVIGFLGGAGGIIFGYGLGQLINYGLNVMAQNLGGESFKLFILPLWFTGIVLLISLSIGLLSGLWPAIRASRLSPREAFIKK